MFWPIGVPHPPGSAPAVTRRDRRPRSRRLGSQSPARACHGWIDLRRRWAPARLVARAGVQLRDDAKRGMPTFLRTRHPAWTHSRPSSWPDAGLLARPTTRESSQRRCPGRLARIARARCPDREQPSRPGRKPSARRSERQAVSHVRSRVDRGSLCLPPENRRRICGQPRRSVTVIVGCDRPPRRIARRFVSSAPVLSPAELTNRRGIPKGPREPTTARATPGRAHPCRAAAGGRSWCGGPGSSRASWRSNRAAVRSRTAP